MKPLLLLTGLFMLPLCAGATLSLADMLQMIRPGSLQTIPLSVWWLTGGFLLWLFAYMLLPRPVRSYVIAHELTHALWALITGARVKNIRVSKTGGVVTVSKNNIFITLAPYFFPFYTMLLVALYLCLNIFIDLHTYYGPWLGLIGFTWGFHFSFTIAALLEHQSDINHYGRLFSYCLIYFLNLTGLGLWIVAVTPVSLDQWAAIVTDRSVNSYIYTGQFLLNIIHSLQ